MSGVPSELIPVWVIGSTRLETNVRFYLPAKRYHVSYFETLDSPPDSSPALVIVLATDLLWYIEEIDHLLLRYERAILAVIFPVPPFESDQFHDLQVRLRSRVFQFNEHDYRPWLSAMDEWLPARQ